MRLFMFFAFLATAFALSAAGDAFSPDAMTGEAVAIVQDCQTHEAKIAELVKRAIDEKDIKWKLCLGDTAVTARGIAASAVTATARMGDLIGAGKPEPARAQLALLRGLGEASKKAFLEAQACPRQLTKVTDGSEIKKEHDPRKTGSAGADDGLNEAMGIGFTGDMVTERSDALGDDPIDAAGTDEPGGPTETPGNIGDDPGVVEDNFEQIADPPFQPVSPEK